ncbi:monocarboxylate transporter, putative [Plasmodium malariae]|uniref:Monocarboxylate transporter, putative n=1 Tax=Plasmodium malariae TaxID=5858 RepID=A0A1D3JMN3_PLAMA|nr:monocarboxylate transporter, putative [Plasmodium malariae]SBT87917.1 monocarboxylate transporter, putative [Plasmodium malariae]
MNILPRRVVPYVVLLGAFLYNLNIGIINSYGNLNIYLTSYLRHKGQNVTYKSVSLIYELTVITLGISMLVGNVVQQKLGERMTILICSFTTFLSFYLSSIYAHSYYLLCLFMGFCYAVGYGICFTIPLSCAYKHFKTNRGLISGIVISAISLSPFMYCPLQTLLINRRNVLPVKEENGSKELYFDDIDVLNRVPYLLFVQSIIFLIFGTLGGYLATIKCEEDNSPTNIQHNHSEKIKNIHSVERDATDLERNEHISLTGGKGKNSAYGESTLVRNGVDYITNNDNVSGNNVGRSNIGGSNVGDNNRNYHFAKPFKKKKNKKKNDGALNGKEENLHNESEEHLIVNNSCNNMKKQKFFFFSNLLNFNNIYADNHVSKYYNKKCTEDVFFILLWISIVFFNCYINFIIMYWKIIGITYTSVEDKLITLNGSFINSISNIAGRLIWGTIYDKFKLNITLLFLGISITFACFLLPAISHIYVLYVFVCALFYFCIGGSFVTIPIITLKKYGEQHFPLNMSILYTTRIANTFLCSFVVHICYNLFTLRCLSAAFGFISLLSTISMFILAKS